MVINMIVYENIIGCFIESIISHVAEFTKKIVRTSRSLRKSPKTNNISTLGTSPFTNRIRRKRN